MPPPCERRNSYEKENDSRNCGNDCPSAVRLRPAGTHQHHRDRDPYRPDHHGNHRPRGEWHPRGDQFDQFDEDGGQVSDLILLLASLTDTMQEIDDEGNPTT